MLFNVKPLKDIYEVRKEIDKIIAKQKRGSDYDISSFGNEINELVSLITEFNNEWRRFPVVFRVAKIEGKDSGFVTAFRENILLPDTKHDLSLIIKMLNHMRMQKKLKEIKMPVFVQPDELHLAYKNGKTPFLSEKILMQMSVIFQKGTIMFVGFIFDKNYFLLEG